MKGNKKKETKKKKNRKCVKIENLEGRLNTEKVSSNVL
jgi:hypothetical protein